MAQKTSKVEEKGAIEIDPKDLPEGTCSIRKWGERKVCVCKDGDKIKIFEVVKEE